MRHMKLMKRILLFVLFVFLMSLFTSTFVSALQQSDDNSDESTTVSSRQRRFRCPFIKNSLANGWVRIRNRGRIAKFTCNSGYTLLGNRASTCIRARWNSPLPTCAKRGCQPLKIEQGQYNTDELSRATLINVSCKSGYSLSGGQSSFRVYCDGSLWRILGSGADLSTTHSDRYHCKQKSITELLTNYFSSIHSSDTPGIESHFITSEEIPTISPLNSAVTAKSETTTNSKFNSKMPEMTAMSVSSVININAMSTERTSLSADNSKTPITETTDKSYTSTDATNIIQEVSTLTTTTTLRFNTLQTQSSSTETTETHFTTLSKHVSLNDTNYSTKSPQLIHNISIHNSPNFSSTPWPTTLTPMSSSHSSTPFPFSSSTVTQSYLPSVSATSTTSPLKSTSSSYRSTPLVLTSVTFNTTLSPKQTTQSLSTSITRSTIEMRTSNASIPSKAANITKRKNVLTTDTTLSPPTTNQVLNNYTKVKINTISVPFVTSTKVSIGRGSTQKERTPTRMRYSMLNKITEKMPEMRVTTALSSQRERSSVKISTNKMTTIPNERNSMVSTTRQSLSSPSMNSMKYSLFAENTTITPMRRRRQNSTKASPVVTSIALEESSTKRGLTISLSIISMTILVTILSLYLIKKRKNSQQNRLSDDSEMLYLSSNEVF